MVIKYQALQAHLQRNLQSLYVLVGTEFLLLNEAAQSIKKAWHQRGETDETKLQIETPSDWSRFQEEINSYSLFADQTLIDARFDKKSIDSAGKDVLLNYIKSPNPQCLIILHTYTVPLKQLQWLATHQQVAIVQIPSLSSQALKHWITLQLKQQPFSFDPNVTDLIHQYAQGNLLACAQVIEKLSLLYQETDRLNTDMVRSQLIDQCEYDLYELADACLSSKPETCIHLLRQSYHHRIEPTLLLWLMTQEVRQLIQLTLLIQQKHTFVDACHQLKIWSQRTHFYDQALKRLPLTVLYRLLHDSKIIDEQIKTSQGLHIWHGLENLALRLCSGISK